MPYPDKPVIQFDYSAYGQSLGDGSLPGQELDNDFANLKDGVDSLNDFVRGITRSDGALKNGIVTREALSDLVLLTTNLPPAWSASTTYTAGQPVVFSDIYYVCAIGHTSSATFAADLAAARWVPLSNYTAPAVVGANWTEVGPFGTSSGTEFDVNGIPNGVAEIEIMFDFVSLSGTDNILVQLGKLGDPLLDTSGYQSGRVSFTGTSVAAPGTISDDLNPGFLVRVGAAGAGLVGTMRLVRGASTTLWHYTLVAVMDGTTMQFGAGRKYLAGARMDRFRVTCAGSNTFDGGFINVRYR